MGEFIEQAWQRLLDDPAIGIALIVIIVLYALVAIQWPRYMGDD